MAQAIDLFGYNVKIEHFAEEQKGKEETSTSCIRIRITYKERQAPHTTFIDEFTVSHKNADFLSGVVSTISACFSQTALDKHFIQYNKDMKSFEFSFESKTSTLTVLRTCELSKAKYSKEEAIAKIRDANKDSIGAPQMCVECINAHHITDPQWELEVTLSVPPGIYSFHVPDLLSKPIRITVRDYIRIRDYYMHKLKDFYARTKIHALYLQHIAAQGNKFIWTKMGLETGPMANLYQVLSRIGENDKIWSNLFELCLIDVYETDENTKISISISNSEKEESIADYITEESIANFIALSIRYYCLQKQSQSQPQLTAADKYLLSIVLPYFESNKEQILPAFDESQHVLTTGLFNRFVIFDQNTLQIDGEELKKSLLLHLHTHSGINVIKHVWRLSVSPSDEYHHLIEKENDLNQQLLVCYDRSFEYEWTMWTNKGLKRLYVSSKGYWKMLNEFDAHPRVPINHLNAIKTLITKHKNQKLRGTKIRIYSSESDFKEQKHNSEYSLNNYNARHTTLSIRIIRAFDPLIDGKKKIKTRDSYFLYYKPFGTEGVRQIDWAWYNNDRAKYEAYNLGGNVTKQIEATYQGVQEFNFPLAEYHRKNSEQERLFIDAQLTELSNGMVKCLGLQFKPFVLRFTFNIESSKVINMEQVAINANDGSQFPRNIRRLEIGESEESQTQSQNDHRIYSMGTMAITINIDDSVVCLRWVFEKSMKECIDATYTFESKIEMDSHGEYKDLVKGIKELWRSNNLFDQYQSSIKVQKQEQTMYEIHNTSTSTSTSNRNTSEIGMDELNQNAYKTRIKQMTYDEILNGMNEANQISDSLWSELDAMDESEEKLNTHSSALKLKFKKYHTKDSFKKKIFTLVSLERIQSIVSVIKQQIEGGQLSVAHSLIIAFSNEQLLFDSPQTKQSTKFEQSLSYIFDTGVDQETFIKRIDSKNTIYDIRIAKFAELIIGKDYLHDFMALSSKAFKSTLFIFKRANSPNIYISHNGFIRKLLLHTHNEDLYYFLPSFITLQIGSFVDIESFCYRDCGTIIKRYLSPPQNVIYYKIRSSQNVFYILSYYQITNRVSPRTYYSHCRKALLSVPIPMANTNTNTDEEDPSDPTHPMHMISLALFESSKQAISRMNQSRFGMDEIESKLKQCGNIYLVHRTAVNAEISDSVREMSDTTEIISQFHDLPLGNDSDLDAILLDLEKQKLIGCKKAVHKTLSYAELMAMNHNYYNANNKLYIISVVERRELSVTIDDTFTVATETETETVTIEDEDEDEDYQSDSDNWVTYEEEEEKGDDALLKKAEPQSKQKIEIVSTFECTIMYEYEMSRVYRLTKSVQDLMSQSQSQSTAPHNKWSVDENRLLTFFYNNMVYNEYDLNDKNMINKLRAALYSQCHQPHFIKLYKKFDEFMKRISAAGLPLMSNNNLINGVEVTRNAILLQQSYLQSRNTMVITYNPLQSCVITPNSAKDITHPIHIYRSAYSLNHINGGNAGWMDLSQLQLYNGWMRQPSFPASVALLYKSRDQQQPKANIIDTLSLLIRYNKKYEIVLIPSSVSLLADFLSLKCDKIAPDIDAIATHRVTFIYKGILYNYSKEETEDKEESKDEEETKEDDRFFLDEIKFLVRKIKENIREDSIDWMDIALQLSAKKKKRLRSRIKRNNGDIMLRWLKIGCGSCFLHEPSGRQTEIGPPPSMDYDNDFPDLLKQAMFIYYIDCQIPVRMGAKQNRCDLCQNWIIEACSPCGQHSFCYQCIKQWQEMIDNPDWGTLKENYDANKVNLKKLIANDTDKDSVLQEIILPKYCPQYIQCHHELKDNEIAQPLGQDRKTLPLTVYQQLKNENDTRYERLNLLNMYQQKREIQLMQDQSTMTTKEFLAKHPKYRNILSGYKE